MPTTRHVPRLPRRLWNCLRGRGQPTVPRRSDVMPGSDVLWPEGVQLDPTCPSCGGRRTVRAASETGRRVAVPCPECAPNDALGG